MGFRNLNWIWKNGVCVFDPYHSWLEGDTSADVSQFSASFWGVDAHPGPPPVLILAPAGAGKEDHSHTETTPPVHTNNCQHNTTTAMIIGRAKMPHILTLFVLTILLIQPGVVQQAVFWCDSLGFLRCSVCVWKKLQPTHNFSVFIFA